jgi:hypothetical protein
MAIIMEGVPPEGGHAMGFIRGYNIFGWGIGGPTP